jgi:hypothetical protein
MAELMRFAHMSGNVVKTLKTMAKANSYISPPRKYTVLYQSVMIPSKLEQECDDRMEKCLSNVYGKAENRWNIALDEAQKKFPSLSRTSTEVINLADKLITDAWIERVGIAAAKGDTQRYRLALQSDMREIMSDFSGRILNNPPMEDRILYWMDIWSRCDAWF